MTREEKINIMHELELLDDNHYGSLLIDKLIKFAELIAAAERERCAGVCDARAKKCEVKLETIYDKDDMEELKANAWQFSVLAGEIRKLK